MVFVAKKNSGDAFSNTDEQNAPDLEDLPPEFCHYRDEGCDMAESCLHCPYPDCLKEMPGGKKRAIRDSRNRQIRKLCEKGWQAPELALLYGVSIRTVQRALKESRGSNRKLLKILEKMAKGER